MKTIVSGPLYAIYDKDNKGLLTLTGGLGGTTLLRSIVADTDITLAERRMEALQQGISDRLCLAQVEVNITEIL